MVENVGCSNGITFTLDRSGVFHTDSFAREISLFDYDVDHGALHNRRPFARFAKRGRNAR
jgi:D-xylonolactonase